VTPLEENKSFLEKVQQGGLLCGLHEESINALTKNGTIAGGSARTTITENPLSSLAYKYSLKEKHRKQQHQGRESSN
jgi:hypothetical protein